MADLPAHGTDASRLGAPLRTEGDAAPGRAPHGPQPPGAAPDGAERPEVARDGFAHDGFARDGSARDGSARDGADRPGEMRDVWTRTEPRYRKRAFGLLMLNLALFCGLCVFAFWLREARLFDFSPASYLSPARFWGASPDLTDFLLEPINVTHTPLHAIVLGLLFGATITVPIVVSILYRFSSAVPFCAAVLVFAHMPWMAATLTLSCVLASLPPFRMKFRYGSALVGILPVLLYLLLAGGTSDVGLASPMDKTLMAMPWVLAILAAAAMSAICLQFARALDYRPGPVAPIVSVMFATPVVLFHVGVGVDELEYRLLERQWGPRSHAFEPAQDFLPQVRRLVTEVMRDEELSNRYMADFLAVLSGERYPYPRILLQYFTQEFLADRAEAYEACGRFIANHPRSRYKPAALFIQARVLDTRLDERRLTDRDPTRELYFEFPHVQSQRVWSALLREHPDSEFAAAAALRLAQLHVRAGEIDQALALLEPLRERMAEARPAASRPARAAALAPTPAARTLGFDPEPFAREGWQLYDLLRANRGDPRYGDEPLRELACLDPQRAGYAEQLLRLANRCPDALLFDNLLVAYALTLSGEQRAAALERIAARLPDGDAAGEALVRLAKRDLQAPLDPARVAAGLERLRVVARQDPAKFWSAEARRLLAMHGPPDSAPAEGGS